MIRTYSELSKINSFKDRYQYLRLNGSIGEDTFGFDRYLNQIFYQSREWRHVRDVVIARDNGCDLGVEGYDIYGRALVHHMNPILLNDIEKRTDILMNPEYLITTTQRTHNAIHYGDEGLLFEEPVDRFANDTCPWKNLKEG